jgi:NAD(P)-dependent dehydrogenase (short-subunit alcohol dehydrogenase family)
MGNLEDKVALITGATQEQGRARALHLARQGADIIAMDSCEDIAGNTNPLATPADLKETAQSVKALNRRIVARKSGGPYQGQMSGRSHRGRGCPLTPTLAVDVWLPRLAQSFNG